MPELPEVETIARGISSHIEHQIIKDIVIRKHQLRWKITSNLSRMLKGKSVSKVIRRGKYILLMIEEGALILHLGMSGSLRIIKKNIPPEKHDHVDIQFKNKTILRFNDPRRFGAVIWTPENPYKHKLLAKLGPEPLTKNFSGKYLFERAKSRTVSIKTLIMNHEIVAGVGNIYASESLFLAKIHPAQAASSLSLKQMENLASAIKNVLHKAIKKGGTTLRDFIDSEGKPGYFANELQVYGRADLPCLVCHSEIALLRIGQRSTFYCRRCQR